MASVLVVDGSEESQGIFRDALQGHVVLRLESGLRGLEVATSREFDAIFFDLDLHDLDGIEALRFIRACGAQAPMTFISSDRTSPALMQAARDNLGFDVLRRPLTAATVAEVLDEMMRLE